LQTKAVCNRYEEEGEELKNPHQQSKEVFLCEFDDPFADYVESMSNINPKIFLSDEGWSCHLFKWHFHKLWSFSSFGSRSSMILASQLLSWLLWKFSFT
jgi:hypothetical protein